MPEADGEVTARLAGGVLGQQHQTNPGGVNERQLREVEDEDRGA